MGLELRTKDRREIQVWESSGGYTLKSTTVRGEVVRPGAQKPSLPRAHLFSDGFPGLPLLASLLPSLASSPLSPLASPYSEWQQDNQSCKIKRQQTERKWPESNSNSNAEEHRHQETAGPLCRRLRA